MRIKTLSKDIRAAMMAAKVGAVDGLDTLAMRQGCEKFAGAVV